MPDPVRLALGVLVLLAPGFVLTWVFVPWMDWARFLVVSVLVALTIPPATLYLLNVFLGVPLTALSSALVSLALALAGLGWKARTSPALARP